LAQFGLKDAVAAERDLAAARKSLPGIDDLVRRQGFDFTRVVPPLATPARRDRWLAVPPRHSILTLRIPRGGAIRSADSSA
jgi:hypothetical protein